MTMTKKASATTATTIRVTTVTTTARTTTTFANKCNLKRKMMIRKSMGSKA